MLPCPKEHTPYWVFSLDNFKLSLHIPRGNRKHVESSGFVAHATGSVQPDAELGDVFLTVFRQKFSLVFFPPSTITTTLPPTHQFCPLLPCRQMSIKPEAATFSGILTLEAPLATLKSQLKPTQQAIKEKQDKA